ncbi:hypothetical protein F896_02890, partial [Acinetobacter genomosp. 15BJ]
DNSKQATGFLNHLYDDKPTYCKRPPQGCFLNHLYDDKHIGDSVKTRLIFLNHLYDDKRSISLQQG